MSQAVEHTTNFLSSRHVIIISSIGFIGTGIYSFYRAKHLDKSFRKTFVMALSGLPIGYGVSQIVNDSLRHQVGHDRDQVK